MSSTTTSHCIRRTSAQVAAATIEHHAIELNVADFDTQHESVQARQDYRTSLAVGDTIIDLVAPRHRLGASVGDGYPSLT